ncbi:uncharacterized protein EI90DRAFT_3081939 [Cantharellus anzutake]|uniref:uncharacterized protein n=1 Tax=Cantharellus anzutake TaxID=1750568 RepID=UPI00190454A8|nr:uncharacterized protein EI90DRAFT_3081939 [Cantharellus anzutake]KAF8319517.1 hypothetical protein EI90DRAFT_3081939 [Cantharellus anzutake]
MAWCRSTEDSETRLMLLIAVAGSGKTAIAHSISERCAREGILLSSFFFKAGKRWRPDFLFSAIARSLAAYDPVYRAFIKSTLRKDPSLSSAPLLLSTPWTNASRTR